MTRVLSALAVVLLADACIAPPVIDDGTLLVDVDAGSSQVTQLELRLSGPTNQQRTESCAAGTLRASFELIAAGRYALVVIGQDRTGRTIRQASRDDVIVAAGQRTTIALRLEPLATGDGGATDLADAGADATGATDAAGDSGPDAAADACADRVAPADRAAPADRTVDEDAAAVDRAPDADAAVADGALGADILVGLWRALPPAGQPPLLAGSCVAHDAIRGVTVVFGGSEQIPPAATDTEPHYRRVEDVWELSGTSWSTHHADLRPEPRSGCKMAYDGARGRVVMFGGNTSTEAGWERDLDDTWAWDGASWTEIVPAVRPLRRAGAALVYDSARDRVVLFGGATGSSPVTYLKDTWELVNGAQWVEQLPPRMPTYRSSSTMAYDPVSQRSLLFGGYDDQITFADTWAWDGANWSAVVSAPFEACCQNAWMTFDIQRQRFVLFNGYPVVRTREFDWIEWRDVTVAEPPPPIGADALIYDVARRQAVLIDPISRPQQTQRLGDILAYQGPGSTIAPSGQLAAGFPVVRDGDAGGHLLDEGHALAVDRLGQVWAAGVSHNGLDRSEAMVWKFLPSGRLAQGFPIDLAGDSWMDSSAEDIAVDPNGTVWVGGTARLPGEAQQSAALWRLDQAGNRSAGFPVIWRTSIDRATYLEDVVVGPAGDVWGAGWNSATATEHGDALLFHWGADGVPVTGFPAIIAGPAGEERAAHAIAVASSGLVFVCGSTWVGAGDTEVAHWRFDSDGVLAPTFPKVWGSATAGDDGCSGIAVDASQAVWLVGQTRSGGDVDLLLLKYDASGELQPGFAAVIDGGAHAAETGNEIAIAANGAVWVAGAADNASGDGDFALWQLDGAGVLAPGYPILRDSDAGGQSHDFGTGVAVDPFGYVWATGGSYASDGLNDFVLWKFE